MPQMCERPYHGEGALLTEGQRPPNCTHQGRAPPTLSLENDWARCPGMLAPVHSCPKWVSSSGRTCECDQDALGTVLQSGASPTRSCLPPPLSRNLAAVCRLRPELHAGVSPCKTLALSLTLEAASPRTWNDTLSLFQYLYLYVPLSSTNWALNLFI